MVKKIKLKNIFNYKGNIIKLINKKDKNFISFGELYISSIKYGQIKGWKKHTKMNMNLYVISGDVQFVTLNNRTKRFNKYRLNNLHNSIYIPNNTWFAFKGLSKINKNLVMNFADIIHQDNESINLELESFKYKW